MLDAAPQGDTTPKTKRALVVDDSPTACAVLARMLRHYHFTSDSVHCAQAALDYLVLEKPDVIFMDHAMPGMSGLDALKILKAHPDYATIPVMMYTASTGEVYLSQARALGAVDVLPKGVEQTVLEEALRRLNFLPEATASSYESSSLSHQNNTLLAPIEHTIPILINRAFRSEIRPAVSHQIHDAIDEWRNEALLTNRRLTDTLAKQLFVQVSDAIKPIKADLDWQFIEQHRDTRRTHNRAIFMTLGLLIVFAVAAFIGWRQWSLQQQQMNAMANARFLQFEQTIQTLQTQLGSFQQDANARQSAPEPAPNRWLQDNSGNLIGAWVGFSENGSSLLMISPKGYRFSLDHSGALSSPLTPLFFLSPACFGAAYAPVHEAMLLRVNTDELWYSPKDGRLTSVQIHSMQDANGICSTTQARTLDAREIFPNAAEVTGVAKTRFSVTPPLAFNTH